MTQVHKSSDPKYETIKWNRQVSLFPSIDGMELPMAASLKMRTILTEEQLGELIDSGIGIKQCDSEQSV